RAGIARGCADLQEAFVDEARDEHEAARVVEVAGEVRGSERIVRVSNESEVLGRLGGEGEVLALERERCRGEVEDDRWAPFDIGVEVEVVERPNPGELAVQDGPPRAHELAPPPALDAIGPELSRDAPEEVVRLA